MNEVLFNQIVKSDLDSLNQMVSKEYFELSEFKEKILTLSNSLAMLYQAMGENDDLQKGGQRQVQTA